VTAKTEIAPTSLAMKLVAIMEAVGNVSKGGFNSNQKYKFVRESDVADAVRPELVKHHILVHQTLLSWERLERLITCVYEFRFIDADTGETSLPSQVLSEGWDQGDKAANKSSTAASKYFLLRSFEIGTGDDPEGDEKTDKVLATEAAKAGPRVVRREPTEGQQKGGHSTVPTAPQIAELRKLAKDNGMGVAALTRFIEDTLKGGKITTVTTAADLLNFIQRLTGQQVGTLISALSNEAPEQDVPDDNDPPVGPPPAEPQGLFDDEPQDGVL
jgi:hypothetical protein